jgi:transposase-like protein
MDLHDVYTEMVRLRERCAIELERLDAALAVLEDLFNSPADEQGREHPGESHDASDKAPAVPIAPVVDGASLLASPSRVRRSSHNAVAREVKAQAVALAREQGTPAAAAKYGFSSPAINHWRRQDGELRTTSGRPRTREGNKSGNKITPKVTSSLPVLPPSVSVKKPEAPSNIDPYPSVRRVPAKGNNVTGFSHKPEGSSILSDAKKLEIVDYSIAHGVKAAADHFAVAQDHITDWRADIRKLEAKVRGQSA